MTQVTGGTLPLFTKRETGDETVIGTTRIGKDVLCID